MYVFYNPSPQGKRVGDCVIRAISKALDQSWDTTYTGIVLKGKDHGFTREFVPDGLTVAEFAARYPHGTYVLAISGHVVCVKDGDYFDTWQSGDEIPIYAWSKK